MPYNSSYTGAQIDNAIADTVYLPPNAEDYADLATAVSTISTTETTLIISTTQAATDDLTIPSTLQLKLLRGGSIAITNTKTLTINGQFDAGLFQVFSGTGVVVFGDEAIKEVYPDWWGDVDTDIGAAANKAIASITAVGGVVKIPNGTYIATTGIDLTDLTSKSIWLKGSHKTGTLITVTHTGHGIDFTGSANVTISDLQLNGSGATIPEAAIFGSPTAANACSRNTVHDIITGGSFTKAVGYFFACEEASYYNNLWVTSSDDIPVLAITGTNYNSVTSNFTTTNPASASSNTAIWGHNERIISTGTGDVDGLYLESISDFSFDSFWVGTTGTNARSAINFALADANGIGVGSGSITNFRQEVSTATDYGFYFSGSDNTSSKLVFDNIKFSADTQTIYADTGSSIGFTLSNVTTGAGSVTTASVATLSNCIISASPIVFTIRTFEATNSFLEPQTISMTTVQTSGTGEDTLKTTAIAADTMGLARGIRVKAAGKKQGANGNKTIKMYFGTVSWTFNAAANDTTDWYCEAEVWNTAAAVQRINWRGWNGTTITQGYETGTEDTTAAVTVKVTGECAHASDTVDQTMWTIENIY